MPGRVAGTVDAYRYHFVGAGADFLILVEVTAGGGTAFVKYQ